MVDVVVYPGERRLANLKRIRDAARTPGVRVEPTSDYMRRLIRHPVAGKFRAEGSLEWPNDTFTARRLAEGSVRLAGPSDQSAT